MARFCGPHSVQRVRRHRPEPADPPGARVLRGVLAEPLLPGVHRSGQLREIALLLRVFHLGHLL